MRLSHIRLLTNQFPEMFRFYRDALDLRVRWGDENGVYADLDTGTGDALRQVLDRCRRPGHDVRLDLQPERAAEIRQRILQGAYEPARRNGHRMLASYTGSDTDARLAAVDRVAAELDVTPSQVVLAWMMHQTSPERVALMGPRTLEHYEAAMPALDIKLTAEHLTYLDAAGS
jgi:catechol 2,3-dioxygenase-like lactoylglutathione lyase family enzyme